MLNKVTFIGAGELAESLLKGFLTKKIIKADQVWMTNRSNKKRLHDLEHTYPVHTTQDKKKALDGADTVIFAFRPGDTKEALAEIRESLHENQLIVSLMVGVPTDFICNATGKKLAVVRVMPNTSASIGLSATGMAAGRYVGAAQLSLARELFETVGSVTVVEEEQIDVIAGLSGSGPAYLYYLAGAMQEAGVKEGLAPEDSARLVLQTLKGAVSLLEQSGKKADDLLRAVATPGGTTQAGIDTLDRHHVSESVSACIHQAILRAGEMSGPFQKK